MAGKSWIKIWLSLLGNERFCALTDAEKWGYIHTLMVGEAVAYTFANEGQLRMLVGQSYRYVRKLREVGLINDLTVYQGKERQARVDPTGAERSARYKENHPERFSAVLNGDKNGASLNVPRVKNPPIAPPGGATHRLWALYAETWKVGGNARFETWEPLLSTRVKQHGEEYVADAIRGSKLDPWEGRVSAHDLGKILRPGNMQKFVGLVTGTAAPRESAAEMNAHLEAVLAGEMS